MKLAETIIKAAAAVAAVAGIAYLIVKYLDAIKAWLEKICPCCVLEEDFEDGIIEDEADAFDPDATIEPDTTAAPAAAAEEDTTAAPVADDADFEA